MQGCDIAIEADGDVYVTWGTRNTPSAIDAEGLAIARSVNGGAILPAGPSDRDFHPLLPVRRRA